MNDSRECALRRRSVAARKEREVRTHAEMVKTNDDDDDDEDMLNGPI